MIIYQLGGMMLLSKQFYFKKDALIFNQVSNFDSLKKLDSDMVKTIDTIKIDLRQSDDIPASFLKNFIDLVIYTKINGVVMYLSKELDYIVNDYQKEMNSSDYRGNNSFTIFDSGDKVNVLFFNGIEKVSIKKIREHLSGYKNKKVVLNFNNLNTESLNKFIPSFMGWMMNSGLKKVSFSRHYGDVNDILEKRGVYCMFNVSSSISFPRRDKQDCKYIANKKIDRFLKFANYAALQF